LNALSRLTGVSYISPQSSSTAEKFESVVAALILTSSRTRVILKERKERRAGKKELKILTQHGDKDYILRLRKSQERAVL
jgi:hypothetical protein